MRKIEEFIANADFLPPAFQLLPRLMLLLEDVESNADALADLIRVDPGLTADILRVCNSATYALTYRAENIQQAILRIGFREVHRIMMSVIMSPTLKHPPTYSPNQDLWNHSLAAAVSGQTIASNVGIDADLAFTAALLHDIGKVVLSEAVPDEASKAVHLSTEKNIPLYKAEREIMKVDHAAAGARLLDRWGFPKNISDAIRFHHEPSLAKADPRLASCVCLANVLAYRVENVTNLPEYVRSPDRYALEELGFTQTSLQALAWDALQQFNAAQKNLL